MKKLALSLALAGGFVLPHISRAQFASAVLSYNTGTGFAAGFTNSSAALGAPASGAAVTPFAPPFAKTQIVSIGAGGQLTLQLGSPITHDASHPYGLDFEIFANQFFTTSGGNVSGVFSHAATETVQVSVDGSTWYTLNPSLAPLAGTLYPTDGNGNPGIPVNPSLTLGSFTGQNAAGVSALYGGSAGGTGYDLAWAQDGSGNPVSLTDVDFIRVSLSSGVLDLDAVSVVPEPSVTALLITGFALLAWSARQNKKSTRIRNMFKPAKIMLLGLFAAISVARADTNSFTENFTADPLTNGWQIFGDTNLFSWDATNHDLNVTWDSTQTNSYFYHPLPSVLGLQDAFSVGFDLQLSNAVAGGDFGFEFAIGLFHLVDATNSGFIRGTGFQSPNLIEFDYFPPLGAFGASIDGTMADDQNNFKFLFDDTQGLDNGVLYHVVLNHGSGDPVITVTVSTYSTNGQLQVYSTLPFFFASGPFDDFYVDTFSISSYSGLNADGSIIASGTVGNIAFSSVTRPVGNVITSNVSPGVWQTEFTSRTNWTYTLERSTNLTAWTPILPTVPGTGIGVAVQDTNAPAGQAFYRVLASQ